MIRLEINCWSGFGSVLRMLRRSWLLLTLVLPLTQ
jgi:hypothetical protein